MSEISPYSGGLDRDARRAGKSISRSRSFSQVRMAKVDDETDVAMVKVDALTSTTGSAMSGIVRVAQAQRQLEQLAPEAAGRLAFLADSHSLAMGDILQDLRRDLRRK